MPDQRPTVILADDHPMILESLRKLLEPTLEVVATVTDGSALLEATSRLRPDLVITDISMPDINGVDGVAATRRLGTLSPTTRVLILSFHGEPSWVRAAFDAGAWGYLSKAAALDEIEVAVREVLGGRFYVSPMVTRALVLPLHKVAGPPIPELPEFEKVLTPRELDVARLVGQGLSNKEIADHLGVSVSTVRTHLSSCRPRRNGRWPGRRLALAEPLLYLPRPEALRVLAPDRQPDQPAFSSSRSTWRRPRSFP